MDLTLYSLLLLTIGHNIFVIYSAESSCTITTNDVALCNSGNDDICSNSPNCCCSEEYNEEIRVNGSQYIVKCCEIDECKQNTSKCGTNMYCKNTVGSYECLCLDGFTSIFNTCIECLPNATQQRYMESCVNQKKEDPFCSVLEQSVKSLKESCQKNNISDQTAKEELKKITKEITQSLSNFSIITNKVQKGQFITGLLQNVEQTFLISFLQAPRTQNINTTVLDITMKSSHDICSPGVQSFTLVSADNNMEVPCSLVPIVKGGAVFLTYKRFNGSMLFTPQVSEWDGKTVINSQVVTGTITNPNSKNLTSPVIFKLSHLQPIRPLNKFICVFWDPEKNNWSKEGCETGQSDSTHTICSCTHLSSFALLMAPHEIQGDFTLTLLSYIGLGVSLLCLSLCLLTFILCRTLRSAHTSILTALCGCLFLGQLLFLVGIHQTRIKIVCAIIAGSLQFSFLCAFCWMSIESFLLFMTVRNLRAVNYMASRKSNFPVMCLLGFGIPSVIVGISAAVRPHDYGTDLYCWLSLGIVWSFLGPVFVFIITNTVLLVFTVHLLRKRLASVNTNVSTLKNTRLLTFKAVAQLFILGCTWGIGYFQFGRQALIFSYLFTICNSLQGAYIFLVHCLLNQQVREAYYRLFYSICGQRKQKLDISTTGTLPSGSKDTSMSDFKRTAISTENSSRAMKEQSV
ncbi:adhesion G protein-coupled receptor E1-like [Rana temporaria]|uniref:adhesion G protein-coupled receptor E1-like n=1 Tax=Rana temporaria TaxID=8407 RepID=UPI001AAD50EA|nr:adhesion G protein-coupled receptor E1-like [Rana temporaria]